MLTPHPVWELPPPEVLQKQLAEFGPARLNEILIAREERIADSLRDPLRFGYRPPIWGKVSSSLKAGIDEVLVMGGNRSSKSEWAACHAVEDLMIDDGREREWAFFHSSEKSSIRQQQTRIYKFLPPEVRDIGKQGKKTNVCYTAKNGFSGEAFILPNGSRGYFFNYLQDARVLEGYEWDGAWCDELVPVDFLEAIRFRLVTRRGKLIITFTPVEGYSPTVAEFLSGAAVMESEVAPLLPQSRILVRDCPPGHMPRVMRCLNPSRRVHFFFTSDNPFNSYEEMRKKLEGSTEMRIKERAYGWPEKQQGNLFTKFSSVHIVQPDRLPPRVARYRSIDPANSKSWFIKWYAVDNLGRNFVYREWPDMQNHGEWALPSSKNPDGRPGQAQKAGLGFSILQYKKLMLELEGAVFDPDHGWDRSKAEKIEKTIIDARLGGAVVPSSDEPTSIIDLLNLEQIDSKGRVVGPSMDVVPGSGARIDDGIQLINDRMHYDESSPVTIMNAPAWYVTSNCLQSIHAYREYTGAGGEEGALKDIIDPDRYFLKSDPCYIDAETKFVIEGHA
jgi:phage terminase large subunit-like protein